MRPASASAIIAKAPSTLTIRHPSTMQVNAEAARAVAMVAPVASVDKSTVEAGEGGSFRSMASAAAVGGINQPPGGVAPWLTVKGKGYFKT